MCTTRAVQRISSEAFPVTSAGIRTVASRGIPTCSGAEEAKKTPPRDIFSASVKCSVLSAATPNARKRSGVRMLVRANCRRSDAFIWTSCARKKSVAGSRNKGRYLKPNRAPEAVKYQSPVAKRYQYRSACAALLWPSPNIGLPPCQNASFNQPLYALKIRFDYHAPAKVSELSAAPHVDNTAYQPPSWEAILAAHARIAPRIHRTPVLTSSSLDAIVGAKIFFKCENLQRTGSFKIRGATNAIF